ncbi:MAG: hypothetical protein HY392_04035 [Candidatus Diapherotrites archaeon]|nr:hypothetical protein [Candidatus Diapherotrites archaeon]
MLAEKIRQYISSRYLRFGEEEIWFGKERVLFYFAPHLAEEFSINRRIFGLKYCAACFLAGRTAGHAFVEKHGVPLKKILTPVVELSCTVLTAFGFGSFRTLKVREEGFMVVAGKSTLAKEIKQKMFSQKPVDFALAGVFAGALSCFSSEKFYAVETKCCAQKNVDECVWVAGTEKSILGHVNEFSPENLMWAKEFLAEVKTLEKEAGGAP